MTPRRILAGGALALAAAGLLAACGGSSSSTTTTSAATTSQSSGQPASSTVSRWLSVNKAGKSVTLTLEAGKGSENSGYNFDGYSKGQLAVSIPSGWKVTVRCTDGSTTLPHSCAIVKSAGSATPAFSGSATPDPTKGLAPGASTTFTFTPTTAGTYRIDCLVPGHDPLGMWDTLTVTSGGSPAISANGGGGSA